MQLSRFINTSILGEIPALYLAALLLTVTDKYWFAAAVSGTSIFAMCFLVFIKPRLSCFDVKYLDFPEEEKEISDRIQEIVLKNYGEPMPIKLIKTMTGNLHSNAKMSNGKIFLGSKLLEHHKGHPEEVVSIAVHELGHYYYSHVSKMCVLNVVYMFCISYLVLPFCDNQEFLSAFSINMESQFLTIWLIYILFKNSIVTILGLPIKAYERYREHSADIFSVKMGLGK